MFKKNKIKTINLLLLILFFFCPFGAEGAVNYRIMEAIPGFFNAGSVVSLPDLISSIYKIGIWTVGIASMFMIAVGGFMYATSAGNTSSASSAKGVITDALIGLVVALTSYMFLYIINPDLVNINIVMGPSAVSQGILLSATPSNQDTSQSIQKAGIQDLAKQVQNKVSLAGSGDCKDINGRAVSPKSNIAELAEGKPMTACNSTCKSQGTPCTRTIYSTSTKAMLEAFLNESSKRGGFQVVSIAGGQHGSSSRHYNGAAADIVPSSSVSVWDNYVLDFVSYGALPRQTFCDANGHAVRAGGQASGSFDCDGKTTKGESSTHVHVDFSSK